MARTVFQEDGDGDSSRDDQGEGSVEGDADSRAFMCKSPISFICYSDTFAEFCWLQGLQYPFIRTACQKLKLLFLKTHPTTSTVTADRLAAV